MSIAVKAGVDSIEAVEVVSVKIVVVEMVVDEVLVVVKPDE